MLKENLSSSTFANLKFGYPNKIPVQRTLIHETFLDETRWIFFAACKRYSKKNRVFVFQDQNIERRVRKICKKLSHDSTVINTRSWRDGESKVNELFARIKKKSNDVLLKTELADTENNAIKFHQGAIHEIIDQNQKEPR